MEPPPFLALTQGDPAGVGPEILFKLLAARPAADAWRPVLVAERPALAAAQEGALAAAGEIAGATEPFDLLDRLEFLSSVPTPAELAAVPEGRVPVVDPVGVARRVVLGRSEAADAAGAVAALDCGIELAASGAVAALVTGPVSKASIARYHRPDFRGHTDYLAAACGLERYGRDYLMAFLSSDLQVALLSTHEPLRRFLDGLNRQRVGEALDCLHRHAGGRIALAGLNPHAGEGGLMGGEETALLEPAVAAARDRGIEVSGPESPDSLFSRARRGEFDWVLALYHDQGLIAVKTAAFGQATNWTLGLPFLRTSVDHGTAFEIAGSGRADAGPLRQVVETTLGLVSGELPRTRPR